METDEIMGVFYGGTTLPTWAGQFSAVCREKGFPDFQWSVEEEGDKEGAGYVLGETESKFNSEMFQQVSDCLAQWLSVDERNSLRPIALAPLDGDEEDENADPLQMQYQFTDWYWRIRDRVPLDNPPPTPVSIAHMDTGMARHPCVNGRFNEADSMNFFLADDQMVGNGVLTTAETLPGFMSHGLATGALIIGGPGDNDDTHDLQLPGMLPPEHFRLRSCRVAESVILDKDDLKRLADAIYWAVGNMCKVITISLGSIYRSTHLKGALEAARDSGVIVCCAAGQYVPTKAYPAAYSLDELCICCGASDHRGKPWDQSYWKKFPSGYVTISAPGRRMPKACWIDANTPDVIKATGSSYSTAMVASVAALWYATHWNTLTDFTKLADRARIGGIFKDILQKTRIPYSDTRGLKENRIGPGIINPNAVLAADIFPYLK